MAMLNPAIMVFGFPMGSGTKGNRRERGGGTADGGRCSAIDYMVDSFGPNPNETPEAATMRMERAAALEKRMAASKRFQVTPNTRQGGSGLFDGDE